MGAVELHVGDTRLVRVPYADVLVDAAAVSLTPAEIRAIPWAEPRWAEGEQVRVGAAAWVIESHGTRIVVDPAQAADAILRNANDAAAHEAGFRNAFTAAGLPVETIDTVVLTHLDGIGMAAARDGDGWVRFFPDADVIVTQRELEFVRGGEPFVPDGRDALLALVELGAVTLVGDEHRLTPDVLLRTTGGHTPGHQVVRVEGGDAPVTMVGHLALSPLHCARVPKEREHIDAARAHESLVALRDEGGVLIGPLWPAPGAARWTGTEMAPITQPA